MTYLNRKHAGQLLAEKLLKYKNSNPQILALPRGGVPVASEIATALRAPMDVLIVRKIGAPYQPELAVGALCEDEAPIWNPSILSRMGLEPDDMHKIVKKESDKIKKQIQLFREGRELTAFEKKTVIVVDDGLATGSTMLAAVNYLKKKGVTEIIVAAPIAADTSCEKLRAEVAGVVVLDEREDLRSVGEWYIDFTQVSDEQVVALLEESRKLEKAQINTQEIVMPLKSVKLIGDLTSFSSMKALIIFAHGSGSSRKSTRNRQVARYLNDRGFGTLLFDLLEDQEALNRKNVFDLGLLNERLVQATYFIRQQKNLKDIPIGFFGASTGAGAALIASAKLQESEKIFAVVSRGGRPDLAGETLKEIVIPTLLIVGGLDYDVIDLNEQARKSLRNCELKIVPDATHLFEEPGALENVSQLTEEWFSHYLPGNLLGIRSNSNLVKTIGKSIKAVRSNDDYEELINSIKSKRVVMLGESTHGTQEFYELRSLISKRLIKEHGFKFIAIEGDWPDAYRLHNYIQRNEGESAKNVLMKNHRWPTWMWANEEIAKLIEWMKTQKSGFYGLDVYSLFESIEEVVNYLNKRNPELARDMIQRYACFNPFQGNEISYARSLLKYPPGCENEVLQNLKKILEIRIESHVKDGDELFSVQQNAHVISQAEAYYRAMLSGDASSWNVRDGHMMDTLDRLLERHGEGAKAIVWAHNTHIGDYRATDMESEGYVNLGGLARQCYGDENVALIGLGAYYGEVLAGPAWGAPEQVMPLPPANEESYEQVFHDVALEAKANQLYVILNDKLQTSFSQRRGHRAVGVVYDPQQDRRGHYVSTNLSKRYDAFVFFDKTQALKSLHAFHVRGEFPETWPTGL